MVTYDENLINGVKEEINGFYTKLGERFYELHGDEKNEEYADIIASIKECEGRIAEHKRQVLAEAGLMQCPKCGEEIDIRSMFCNFCGTRVKGAEPVVEEPVVEEPVVEEPVVEEPVVEEPVVEEPVVEEPVVEEPVVEEPKAEAPAEPRKCSKCGNILREGVMFCTECGTPVGKEAPADEPEKEARFCTECGSKIDSDVEFCTNCGARLGSAKNDQEVFSNSHEETPEVRRCPFCGFNTTDKDIMFCIECGAKLV